MQDGQGNAIGAFHEGDGTGIQRVYQGDGTVLWERDAMPESAVANWDATELSLSDGETVDPFADNIGSRNLSARGNPIYDTSLFDGGGVFYDGVDDFHFDFIDSINLPANEWSVIIAIDSNEHSSGDDGRTMSVLGPDRDSWFQIRANDDEEGIFYRGHEDSGDNVVGPIGSFGGEQIITVRLTNDVTANVRLNADEKIHESLDGDPYPSLDRVALGDATRDDSSFFPWEGGFAEVVIYNEYLSDDTVSNEEQRIAEKHGISLS